MWWWCGGSGDWRRKRTRKHCQVLGFLQGFSYNKPSCVAVFGRKPQLCFFPRQPGTSCKRRGSLGIVATASTTNNSNNSIQDHNNNNGGVMALTQENVEQVLEELRPYLIADGGNVSLAGIDGATVRLVLEGACGTCPSSTVTLRMGIETRLKEKIPEIEAVVQEESSGPELNEQNIDKVLDEVRPFLKIAGGKIQLVGIYGLDSPAPSVSLKMSGGGAAVDSVRLEIIHRLKRNFPKLVNVHYVKDKAG